MNGQIYKLTGRLKDKWTNAHTDWKIISEPYEVEHKRQIKLSDQLTDRETDRPKNRQANTNSQSTREME